MLRSIARAGRTSPWLVPQFNDHAIAVDEAFRGVSLVLIGVAFALFSSKVPPVARVCAVVGGVAVVFGVVVVVRAAFPHRVKLTVTEREAGLADGGSGSDRGYVTDERGRRWETSPATYNRLGEGDRVVATMPWGALFGFHPDLPPSAMESGADLAIGSVHKSMSGLSQTSFLSVQGDRIYSTRLQLAFENFESSSSSALLIASIDAARRQFVEDGERLIGDALELARELRSSIGEIRRLRVMGDEILDHPGASGFNPLHVSFDVTGLGITGYHASDWLRGRHGLATELADHRRLMALVSFGDCRADIHRLMFALHDLADNHSANGTAVPSLPMTGQLRTDSVMTPRDAFYAPTRMLSIDEASGEVAAEMLCPYPPGIPVILPGERFTDAIVDFAQRGAAAGFFVDGVADPSLSQVRVVAG